MARVVARPEDEGLRNHRLEFARGPPGPLESTAYPGIRGPLPGDRAGVRSRRTSETHVRLGLDLDPVEGSGARAAVVLAGRVVRRQVELVPSAPGGDLQSDGP